MERDDIEPYHSFIDKLIEDAPQLKKLPLFFSHFDLNEMNVLVADEGEISGIVDWELALEQLFGIDCSAIHFLAGETVNKKFGEKTAYEAMERGFWNALMGAINPEIRSVLESNVQAIQTSVMIGTLFKVVSIEEEKVFISQIVLIRYRIPALRGTARPYSGGLGPIT